MPEEKPFEIDAEEQNRNWLKRGKNAPKISKSQYEILKEEFGIVEKEESEDGV